MGYIAMGYIAMGYIGIFQIVVAYIVTVYLVMVLLTITTDIAAILCSVVRWLAAAHSTSSSTR